MEPLRDRTVCVQVSAVFLAIALWGAPGQAQQLGGKGQWQSISGDAIRGTWTVTLTRTGSRVQGNLQLTGSNVLTGGVVTGDIDANSVVLGVMADGAREATFSAKLNGTSIAGEWQCDLVKDHGVWFGSLSPVASDAAPPVQ
jgi:hypothetical protein